jgi:hypothetical protein
VEGSVRKFKVLSGFAFLVISVAALAQTTSRNELGLTLGLEVIPDRTAVNGSKLSFSNGAVFGANFAHRVKGENTALYLEFPFVAAPTHDVLPVQNGSIGSLATLYVTPALRLQFARAKMVSPWVSGGFGYGWFEGSAKFPTGAVNPNRNVNTAIAQFGAGIDVRTPIRILFPLSLRGEVRDFYAINGPNFGPALSGGGQHNITAAGGFVVHF